MKLGCAAGAVLVASLVVLSRAQTRVWHDSRTLWEHAAEVTPTPMVLWFLGLELKAEDPQHAAELFRRAAELNPDYGNAWYEYGKLAHAAGALSEAEGAYTRAVECMEQPYVARVDLGVLYFMTGRREEGVRELRTAVDEVERGGAADRQGRPHMALGMVLLEMGRRAEGVEWIRKAAGFGDMKEAAERKLRELGE